ncbi:MAG: ThiF family adenylyltransferase [Candidatus Saccharimonadales bacterium]
MARRVDNPAFHRNYGFFSEDEQQAINKATVAIAGAGGDGFQLGYKLAMMGVGTLKIADPEVFEIENSNRVFGATKSHIGQNKAKVFREMVSQLPSPPRVVIFEEGVTEENITEFVSGADLVLDESELTYPQVGVMLAREARKVGIPELLVMNIGFAGVATSFHPYRGVTFEHMIGMSAETPLSEITYGNVTIDRFLAYLPEYGDLATLNEVKKGAPLPSITQGVDVASAVGSTEVFLHLTAHIHNNRRTPTWAPRMRYMDSYTNKSGTIRFPRISYYHRAVCMAIRSKLGLNPVASYHVSDRNRRTKK